MIGGRASTLSCPQNRRISGPSGTGNLWNRLREIRLFGCRWCSGMEKSSEADFCNGAASPGEQEVYHTPVCLKGTSASSTLPAAAAIQTKMYSWMLQLFKMLCIISSEKALQFYHCNRTQFAEVFHVIADAADRKQIVNIVVEGPCCGRSLFDFLEHIFRKTNLWVIPDLHVKVMIPVMLNEVKQAPCASWNWRRKCRNWMTFSTW